MADAKAGKKEFYKNNHARLYDLIDESKDYNAESGFIQLCLERYFKGKAISILDLGCGTGNHSLDLSQRGYSVTGIDISDEMIKIAKSKNIPNSKFFTGDIADFDLKEKFDSIICMFAAFGYLNKNQEIESALKCVHGHLHPGGVFVMNCWNGLAVLNIKPSSRERVIEKQGLKIVRKSTPVLKAKEHVCEVTFNIDVSGKDIAENIKEKHPVRFFFPKELEKYYEDAGLEIIKMCPAFDIDKELDENCWWMTVVARKIDKANSNEKEKEGLRVALDSGVQGIKEHIDIPHEMLNHVVEINKDTSVVLFVPDMGKSQEKTDYFVPNLHNGLFRIQAFLEKEGIKCAMVCSDIDDIERAMNDIEKYKPPIIGFSPYYDSMPQDLKNIDRVRDISPNSVIIIGGFEASLNDQWYNLGLIDIVVRGEGEFPMSYSVKKYKEYSEKNSADKEGFLDFLRKSYEQDVASGIKGVDGINIVDESGKVDVQPVRSRISNEDYQKINLIAFDEMMHTLPIKKYWELSRLMFNGRKDSFFRFESSDHCPYKCTFCQSSIFFCATMGKKSSPIRFLEPENIMKILRKVEEVHPYIKGIFVDDENFIVFRDRAIKTLNMMIEAREKGTLSKDMIYFCRTRTDNIDPELCSLLKRAGFIGVAVGSESYSKAELEEMKKNNLPSKNLEAVKEMLDAGLNVSENYISYTPITTPDTFYESSVQIVKNLASLDIDGAATLFITPLPGTYYWGGGEFETLTEFPYKSQLFKDRVMFRNKKNGIEYIGREIRVPKSDKILHHPDIVLVNDPIMRKASLEAVEHLPEVVEDLRKKAGGTYLARNFVTLANIASASRQLHKLTGEARWQDLYDKISDIVSSTKK